VPPADPFPGNFPGTISAAPDVARLASIADVVCRATVLGVRDDGAVTYAVGRDELLFRRKVAVVDVRRVYLGQLDAGASVDVEFLEPDVPAALTELSVGEEDVLFLVRAGTGYRLGDMASGRVRLGDPPGLDALRRVAGERGADERVSGLAAVILEDLS
jgi:hypothetical protein